MKYPWIEEYLLKKTGVTKDLQADWNWIRFQLNRWRGISGENSMKTSSPATI